MRVLLVSRLQNFAAANWGKQSVKNLNSLGAIGVSLNKQKLMYNILAHSIIAIYTYALMEALCIYIYVNGAQRVLKLSCYAGHSKLTKAILCHGDVRAALAIKKAIRATATAIMASAGFTVALTAVSKTNCRTDCCEK